MLSQIVRQKNAASRLQLFKGRSILLSSAKLRHNSHTSRLSSLQAPADNASSETRRRRPSFQSSRSLATAAEPSVVDQIPYFDNKSYTPEIHSSQQWNNLFPQTGKEFNASSLIIVDQELETKPRILRRRIKGIGGDEEEMLANLDLALKLSQFDRATALINRLREYHPHGSAGFLELHNRFLQAIISHAILMRDNELVMQIQRWFEVDMPYGKVESDATTYAIMIRLALRMFHGSKRDRAVRRYWDFAKRADIEEDVLAVPVLSELELGELSEICSEDLQRVAIDSMEPRPRHQTIVAEDQVAAVLPTPQQGVGLTSLKQSIATLTDEPLRMKTDGVEVETKELYDQRRQLQLEKDVMQSALDRWQKETEALQKARPEALFSGVHLATVTSHWHTDLAARIEEELVHIAEAESQAIKTEEQKERCEYALFIRSVDPQRLAALTILAVMHTLVRGGLEKGVKLSTLVTAIGSDLYEEVMANKAIEKHTRTDSSYRRVKILKTLLGGRDDSSNTNRFRGFRKKMEREEPESVWSATIKARVGAVLMNFLFDVAKIPVLAEEKGPRRRQKHMQPAFQHSYQINWGRRSGYIHVHPQLVKTVIREPTLNMQGRHLPMVCKPRPWKGYLDGAYYLYQTPFVRITPGESLQPAYVKTALRENGLEKIRESLDILGGTGWVINRLVFDVMLEAWNTGESIADLAPLEPNLPLPPKPSIEEGYHAEKKWDNLVRDIENQRSSYHSQRCFQNFQLEVARSYLNETFYFPHNMDFRGRAYPVPPYLNQMGADNSRGLLLFSEAKPLGESGLRWLKIQISNLAGFDKASLSEREQFTMDHLDDVLDSANNGLKGRRWWLKAEDPWQCLAACCELRNALQHPVPTEYLSRLPIHQDGSCNGLQHYAALGGDKIGAQQVNLEPSDRPSDVYTGVAEYVRETVTREAAAGNPTAKLLEGKITRKIVKQTVMTNVYGVTFLGAMKQVRKQLIDHHPELSTEERRLGSLYIARIIFEALGSMFNGAHAIQYWLSDCASRITQSLTPEEIEALAKDALSPDADSARPVPKAIDPSKKFRSTVIWTTPLGLPVVQPYRVRTSRRIRTNFQTLNIIERDSNFKVSRRKQLQAFPPNFIHSLDATHMMLSSIACNKAGLTFSAVHDSFWTHPSDVDSMNHILREAFVRMHSDDVIKRLASEFEVRYSRNLWLGKLHPGSRLGAAIHEFRKGRDGVKLSKCAELIEEYKRQTLLNSEDPELQEQGRAMVTAASIFEQMGGTDADLIVSGSIDRTKVGHVPEDLEAADKENSGLSLDEADPALEALLGNSLEASDDLEGAEGALEDEDENVATQSTRRRKHAPWLWIPLRFRDVPKKGEWDLTRIRDSKYFFS